MRVLFTDHRINISTHLYKTFDECKNVQADANCQTKNIQFNTTCFYNTRKQHR